MTTTWVIDRFRSVLFHENLLLIVLSLLKDSELGEWEIWSLLHSRYGTTPTAGDFRRILDTLTNGGYASSRWEGSTRKLRLNETGLLLHRRLDAEYRAIISSIDEFSAASGIARSPGVPDVQRNDR
jgi:DNA-binding PadR family transcriptional regulator